MPRRAIALLFVAAVAFTLAACGGGGGGSTPPNLPSTNGAGSGNGDSATPTPPPSVEASPTADPCGCITVTEKNTKDDLLGGIAVGTDQNIYASTALGVDIFNSQLNLLPSPSPVQAVRIRETWPTVPKAGSPLGAVAAAGSTINALGTSPGTTGSTAFIAGTKPEPTPSSQPFLAQYNIPLQTWSNSITGNYGDKWVSLAPLGGGGTNLFVIGDHLTPSNGWVGFLIGIGISCVSPVFTHPLGAAAMGPDGNLWVATNPQLNGNKGGTQSNPSVLYAINTSTGAIMRTITLPAGSHVSAIAAGAHALWFTDDGLNVVGQVPVGATTATLIPLPNNGNGQAPVSISPDSLGRMWFTEFDGKRVGYVTPSTLQLTILKVTTKGTPMGIVGCVQGQNICPQTNVFFAENIALGAASF